MNDFAWSGWIRLKKKGSSKEILYRNKNVVITIDPVGPSLWIEAVSIISRRNVEYDFWYFVIAQGMPVSIDIRQADYQPGELGDQ